jgi:hypothetical protein
MNNEINAIELTDEQLDMVAGAGTGNTSTQLVAVNGSTTGVNLFSPGASVSGGTTFTNVQAFQSAKDSHDISEKTIANLFSFNS